MKIAALFIGSFIFFVLYLANSAHPNEIKPAAVTTHRTVRTPSLFFCIEKREGPNGFKEAIREWAKVGVGIEKPRALLMGACGEAHWDGYVSVQTDGTKLTMSFRQTVDGSLLYQVSEPVRIGTSWKGQPNWLFNLTLARLAALISSEVAPVAHR